MARTRFSGPLRSSQGYEIGTGTTNTSVIGTDGSIKAGGANAITSDGYIVIVPSTADLSGVGNAVKGKVPAGRHIISMSSTGKLVAVSSTGGVKAITST